MGCDIHFAIEKKKGTKWFGICSTDFGYRPSAKDRNYEFFSQLAGVRGEGPSPKGIPTDKSDLTAECLKRWNGDAHSMTYMAVDEFVAIWIKQGRDIEAVVEDSKYITLDKCLDLGQIVEEPNWETKYRIVIWFDN